jgi:hypothetical protein
MINTKLDRKNYGSIPHNYDRRGLKPLDATPTQIKPVVKAIKIKSQTKHLLLRGRKPN